MENDELYDTLTGEVNALESIDGDISADGELDGDVEIPRTIFEKDYEQLDNLPSLNGNTLIGDKDFEEIGLHFMTNVEIQNLLGGN